MRQEAVFRGSTGACAYDQVQYSAEPIGEIVSRPDSPLGIVRHLGVRSAGLASASHAATLGTLVLNLTTGGSVSGELDGHQLHHPLQRGFVAFVPRDMQFRIDYPAANSALLLFLPQAFVTAVCADLEVGELPMLLAARNERLAQLITMIEAEVRAPGFASDLMIDGLMRAVASILARREGAADEAEAQRVHLTLPKLARVKDYVEARLDADITLADMARVAGLSPFHFSRVFKLATGETPYQFLSTRRLMQARKLLHEGRMPLAELALACGFASQSHFTAAFTKAMGLSPGRYRKHCQG